MPKGVLLETSSQGWRRARRNNATDNGFPSRVPTFTKPSGNGNAAAQTTAAVFDLAQDTGVFVQNAVMMMPYGVGSNNNTFSMRLVGWRCLIEDGVVATSLWIPTDLFEVQCTLTSSFTGATNGLLDTTQLFADTITITGTTANAGVNINVVSPANDRAAYLIVDFVGFQMIEPVFTTGASATSCNALLAML